MKQFLLSIGIIFLAFQSIKGQPVHYFEFITTCGHGNWQETSFIDATSDQAVIDTCLVDLNKPLVQRRFISGTVAHGNAGYNHNASHWFQWHFIPDQWNLVDLAIEVCDGCPYSDLDLYPEYWLDTLGIYCPWSGQIAREIQNPSEVNENNFLSSIVAFPNPASEFLTIETNSNSVLIASIYNSIGVKVLNGIVVIKHKRINLETIEDGIYFIRISTQHEPFLSKSIAILKAK